jgi:hypothetical protein
MLRCSNATRRITQKSGKNGPPASPPNCPCDLLYKTKGEASKGRGTRTTIVPLSKLRLARPFPAAMTAREQAATIAAMAGKIAGFLGLTLASRASQEDALGEPIPVPQSGTARLKKAATLCHLAPQSHCVCGREAGFGSPLLVRSRAQAVTSSRRRSLADCGGSERGIGWPAVQRETTPAQGRFLALIQDTSS